MTLLDLVKTTLNMDITDTSNDEYLQSLIAFSTAFFTNLTGIVLDKVVTVDEVFTKQYGVTLFKIFKGPILSINSVTVDGASQDVNNFYINNQFIISNSQITGEKVVFNLDIGYEVIPEDIKYILSSICEYLFKQDSKSNYFSGEKSFTPSANVLPGYIREMVEGYVI